MTWLDSFSILLRFLPDRVNKLVLGPVLNHVRVLKKPLELKKNKYFTHLFYYNDADDGDSMMLLLMMMMIIIITMIMIIE